MEMAMVEYLIEVNGHLIMVSINSPFRYADCSQNHVMAVTTITTMEWNGHESGGKVD